MLLYDPTRIFPEQHESEAVLLAYRDRVINPWSIVRNQHMSRIALGMRFFLGHQWDEIDPELAFDGVRGSFIREMEFEPGDEEVRSVTNEIDPAIEFEVISLVKRRWTPKYTPTSNDPRIKAAAQVTTERQNYRLKQLHWPEKRHQLGLNFALSGTGLLYTCADRTYNHLRATGSPSAVYCPKCAGKLFSRNVPVATAKLGMPRDGGGYNPVAHLDTARDVDQDPEELALSADDAPPEPQLRLNYCPVCTDRVELQDVPPGDPDGLFTPDDAESGTDVFGRPLGVDEPLVVTDMEVDTPFEFYPEDGGIKKTPDNLRAMGRRKIRSLEWIEERYPHLVHLVSPDSIHDLLYGDPLLGSWDSVGGWHTNFDAGILDYNANVDELIKLPTLRYPFGRYVVCTKDVVLEDGPLLESRRVESPYQEGAYEQLYVPRAMISGSRFKIRPGTYWGTSLVDNELPKQRRLNGLDSQIIETRLRYGPHTMMPKDQWLTQGPNATTIPGVGNFVFYEDSMTSGDNKPTHFNGQTMPDGVYLERDRIQADLQRSAGPKNSSLGMGDKNISATSHMQLSVEMDERSRSLREDELVNSVEKSWSHLTQIEWILGHDDEDVYRSLGPSKTWKYEQWKGSMVRGQTEVTIERGSFVSKSVMDREAAREALADKVVVIDTPLARRRMAEKYGLETDINEDTTVQVEHAERIWVGFMDDEYIPAQDSIDEPNSHWAVLSMRLRTDEGERIATEIGWDEISRDIAGWEDELRNLIMKEAQSIAFYGGKLSGEEAAEAFATATLNFHAQEDLFNQQKAVFDQQMAEYPQAPPEYRATNPPPVAPLPPQPPPPPLDIPALLQDRILLVQKGMIVRKAGPVAARLGLSQGPGAVPPPIDTGIARDPMPYLKLRALVDAYHISAGLVAGLGGPAPLPGGSGATMIPGDKGSPMGLPGGPGAGAGAGNTNPNPANAAPPPSKNSTPEGGKN